MTAWLVAMKFDRNTNISNFTRFIPYFGKQNTIRTSYSVAEVGTTVAYTNT